MAGINEYWSDNSDRPYITPRHVAENIIKICRRIKEKSPVTEIFIQTILPVNNQQVDKNGSKLTTNITTQN